MKNKIKFLITIIIIIIIIIITTLLLTSNQNNDQLNQNIEIVFAENYTTLDPYSFTATNSHRLNFIYEPLIKLDESFNIKPKLAVAYGRIDDLTWEFRINPNVTFHDGSKLDAQLIKQDLDKIKDHQNVSKLLSSIESIEATSNDTLTIKTLFPDPILLNKLALIPIVPNIETDVLAQNPIGTGPYKIDQIDGQTIKLSLYEDYYATPPKFKQVTLSSIPNQEARAEKINDPNVALIYKYPSYLQGQIEDSNFDLKTAPELVVNFFIYNLNRETLQNPDKRKVLSQSISSSKIKDLLFGLGQPISQYVSSGVFGFNSNLIIDTPDQIDLIQKVVALGMQNMQFKVAIPEGLDEFKNFLEREWQAISLDPQIDLLDPEDLISEETKQNYDLIFLGWKSDYGDASQFLQNFAKVDSELNIGSYSNLEVENLIESSQKELDIKTRERQIEQIMQVIVADDPIGIPLFESEVLYAINKNYKYTPRADGLLDIINLSLNK